MLHYLKKKVLQDAHGTAIQKVPPPRRGTVADVDTDSQEKLQEQAGESYVRGGISITQPFLSASFLRCCKLHRGPRSSLANVNGEDVSWLIRVEYLSEDYKEAVLLLSHPTLLL